MKVLAIDNSAVRKQTSLKQNQKIIAENIIKQSKKYSLDVLIFSCGGVRFALKLTNVGQIRDNYSTVFHCDISNSIITGFCLNNNELIKLVNINYLINIYNSNKNQRIIEISRENIKVGFFIDDNILDYASLEIPFENPNYIKYKHIDKIIKHKGENVHLINELSLFSEISKLP